MEKQNNKQHEKLPNNLFGASIIEIIDREIQKIAKDRFADDKVCPPEFWVSLNNEDMKNQKIMITVNHCGVKFTECIFPRDDAFFGYNSVEDQMINMYNQTM